ncbi:MAG: SDR family oxidoreductase [Caulobacterales bacterium]|nr:SDR family oxidoreductase [Caulobacterales bacterium]
MKDVAGMSVLVTGGGSGLGEATARRFAGGGAKVTITGRRADKVRVVAEDIGPACRWVSGDVASATDRQAAVDAAVAHGGGLDVLVNNAGNMYRGPIAALDETKLLEVFHSNVVGAMMLTGLAARHLSERRGAVIFIGSVHTRRAFPGASPYAATKGAVEALTRVLAAELGGAGVRVNCVVPGAVLTEINQRAGLFTDEEAKARLDGMAGLHALGRIGETEEIAEAIDYLARAEWTTGAVLDVDGGLGLGLTAG